MHQASRRTNLTSKKIVDNMYFKAFFFLENNKLLQNIYGLQLCYTPKMKNKHNIIDFGYSK